MRNRPLFIGLGCCWALATVCGVGWLTHYQMTPGQAAAAVPTWPGAGSVNLAADRPTLLMFVHPECDCSQASLGELQELLTVCNGRVATHIYFYKPSDRSEDWVHTSLWNDAKAIGGMDVRLDPDGRLANIFGAKTSGQVMIYNPQGRLLFSGGITDGRGHFGDNAGLDEAKAILRGSAPPAAGVVTSNVYGCDITSPAQKADGAKVDSRKCNLTDHQP